MATDLERLIVQLEANTRRFEREMVRARNTANRELAAIERRAKQTNVSLNRSLSGAGIGGLGGLRSTVGGFGAALGVDQVRRYADAWTEAGNRLKAAEQISGRQARTLGDLNDIADRTRSGISATTELYAKLLVSTRDVAASEQDVARATEIVNKAFKAGGAAASEQAAGVLQLSQALGSGFLQGDELRSIRENAPLLAQAIADEFGTTIAGLKELGKEGELTTDRVFRAILRGAPRIEQAFGSTTATISDGFTVLGNAITETIGRIDAVTGSSGAVSESLGSLAQIVRNLGAAFEYVAQSPAGQFLGFLDDIIAKIDPVRRGLRAISDPAVGEALKGLVGGGTVDQIGNTRKQIAALFAEYRKGLAVIKPASLGAFDDLAAKIDNGTVSASEAKAALEAIAGTDARLQELPRAFDPLIQKLQEVTAEATKAATAIIGINDDERGAMLAARRDDQKFVNFRTGRTSDASRTQDEIELDRRTQDVLDAAEKAGVALTEGAARIQAATELAAENMTRAGESSVNTAAEVIKRFEGFRPDPYWDVNAFRAGFGSDTVTLADGSIQKVTQGISVSLETANRDLARRIGEFQAGIESKIGTNTFRGMTEEQQAALTSIAYNYGSLPQRIVEAIKTGNVETISNAIRGLGSDNAGINRNRRNQEADLFESGAPEALQQSINLRREQQTIIQETIAAIQAQNAAIGLETSLIGASNAEKERARLIQETLNELQRQGITITDEVRAAVEAEANARYASVDAYDQAAAAAERLRQKQEELNQVSAEIAGAFQGAIKGFISDLVRGKDATEALYDAVARLADRLLDIALNQIFASIFGGGLGGGGIFAGLFHSGGRAGGATSGRRVHPAVFAGAQRYHSGGVAGLKPGEVPAILQRGELVIPRMKSRQMMSAQAAQPNVNASTTVINTFDAASFLSEALSQPSGPKLILNAIKAQPAAFRNAIQG